MKKFVLGLAAVAALAVPAVATAAETGYYDATLTVDLKNSDGSATPYNHTFNVVANCTSGIYTGTGNSSAGDTGPTGETINGVISNGSFTGYAAYSRGDGFTWDFNMVSGDLGLNYAGAWGSYLLTGTMTSEKSTDCRNAPAVTSKDQCKKDGWKGVSRLNDSAFKNQGDCVSYVETGV